jgi:hypothetical protein
MGAVFLFVLAPGCSSTTNYSKLDAIERAKLVKQLQDKAEYCFDQWRKSEGADLESLMCYRDSWRETTNVVGPSDHPLAYANYGAALSRVGLYYGTLVAALERELETAKPSEQADIRVRIEKNRADATNSFASSNRQFDIYFQSPPSVIDPKVYRWAIGNSEALHDWKSALHYLDLLEENGALSEQGKKDVAQLRKGYSEALRLQEEKELEHELKGGRASAGESRARPETAN